MNSAGKRRKNRKGLELISYDLTGVKISSFRKITKIVNGRKTRRVLGKGVVTQIHFKSRPGYSDLKKKRSWTFYW